MIISRCSNLFRTVATGIKGKQITSSIRKSHAWHYRVSTGPPPKYKLYIAQAAGGFMWWWILWHLWHESGHITGEFDYPDPSKWTDAELGIPEDDDELGLVASD